MLGESFNDLVPPMIHEALTFSPCSMHMYVHDGVKVVQCCMLHPMSFDFFHQTQMLNLQNMMHKGKWAFDPHPTPS